MTDGNGHTTRYGYDAYGDTIAVTDALGRVSAMAYDTNISRLTSTTDPKHQTSSSSYDAEDRVTQVVYQDGSVTKNLPTHTWQTRRTRTPILAYQSTNQ